MSASQIRSLVRGVEKGRIRALAQAITLLENRPSFQQQFFRQFKSKSQKPSRGRLIGVTGSAGSGKSTLIAALAKVMRSARKKVAIVAVDPTSPKTGGAFLGDRVRMQNLAEDPGVFIRSMASRGAKGGVARATEAVSKLFLKAGYDYVLIETVGAGQLDFDVTRFTDLTILVLTPESGDDMQFMKAGLREMADAFVINKADRPGAHRMADTLVRSSDAPIFKTVAEQSKGIQLLYQFIQKRTSSLRGRLRLI
ncbi:MAG: ATP/GTP-binding protein [Candidatus Omnitrophica bacterium]|nr:ATP/GTP-binding protein [Candidatus Omnitrophota bacterium]